MRAMMRFVRDVSGDDGIYCRVGRVFIIKRSARHAVAVASADLSVMRSSVNLDGVERASGCAI